MARWPLGLPGGSHLVPSSWLSSRARPPAQPSSRDSRNEVTRIFFSRARRCHRQGGASSWMLPPSCSLVTASSEAPRALQDQFAFAARSLVTLERPQRRACGHPARSSRRSRTRLSLDVEPTVSPGTSVRGDAGSARQTLAASAGGGGAQPVDSACSAMARICILPPDSEPSAPGTGSRAGCRVAMNTATTSESRRREVAGREPWRRVGGGTRPSPPPSVLGGGASS